MASRVRVAIIGLGFGAEFIPIYQNHPDVEMYAICAKKESAVDNTPGKRKARESIISERYEQRSKQYLNEVRRGAMLEYK